eukprot:TRINITY_DN92707_c0_g1_i1.p1 TRINITY_DN92707_c0_g1~~TRINITY_DN92707_c0_g1_i1.p1  ORF type:complete len:486 (+),score=67.33 TRINITY_DN92707_c0_g1_i1:228-1685(+)
MASMVRTGESILAAHAPKSPVGAAYWSQPCHARRLYIRNLLGHCLVLHVDLEDDVMRVAEQFARREGLARSSHIMMSLYFSFNGQPLEQGVPLWKYGIIEDSVLSTRICPRAWMGEGSCVSSSSSRPRHKEADVAPTREQEERSGSPNQQRASGSATSAVGPGSPVSKSCWVRVGITILAPFGEMHGTLELPKQHWSSCRLSPKLFTSIYRVSDTLGVNGAFIPGKGIYWQLRLGKLHAYPCVAPPEAADVWYRMEKCVGRVKIEAPESMQLPMRQLVNKSDTLPLAAVDPDEAHQVHLTISLFTDAERIIDDVTLLYREQEKTARLDEVCCLCLDPMLPGEACRRLPCLHSMHAGCAMTLLPTKPSCPVCRASVCPEAALPALLPSTPERTALRRNRVPRLPPSGLTPLAAAVSTALPTLPNSRPSTGGSTSSPGSRRASPVQRRSAGSSPVPRLVKVLSDGFNSIRSRSWSMPRMGQVARQQE